MSEAGSLSSHRGSRARPAEPLTTGGDGASMCACVYACAEEAVVCLFACACVCLRSCDSEHCLGWRTPQPPDTGPEVMAVTFSQTCPWELAALSEEKSHRTLAGILASAVPHPHAEPSVPLSSHRTEEQESNFAGFCPEHEILEAARSPLSSRFMTPEAGQAGGDRCCPDTVT